VEPDVPTLRSLVTMTNEDAAGDLDAAAFDALVRRHQQRLYRLVLGLVRDPDEAESLTQDVFVAAFEHRESFRGEASVGTWLASIAINRVRDRERSRRWQFWRGLSRGTADEGARDVDQVPDGAPDPARVLAARQDVRAVRDAVARLPVRQRAAFTLRYVEEQSLEEIAAALGCEVGTVKSHLARAVAAVRREVR